MDAVFKALADASRRKLLDVLFKNNGQTLSELCEHLDMTRQAVTKHLVLLEEANLVATVWRGREKLHYLNPVPLHEISERWIGKYERHRLQALSDLKKGLEENKNKKSYRYEKAKSGLHHLHSHHTEEIVGGHHQTRIHAPVLGEHDERLRLETRLEMGAPQSRKRSLDHRQSFGMHSTETPRAVLGRPGRSGRQITRDV